MACWSAIEKKVDDFVKNSPKFKEAVDTCFALADVTDKGTLNTLEASACAEAVFVKLQEPLQEFEIQLPKPSSDEVLVLFKEADYDADARLTVSEFSEFLVKLLKLLAWRFAVGFGKKYGLGMLGGTVAIFLVKRALRGVPVVNWATALFPCLLVGPVLGVAAVFSWELGGITGVKQKLFPPKDVQFKQA